MKNRCNGVCFQISITSVCQELAAMKTCGICWVCLYRALPRKLFLSWELLWWVTDTGNGQSCCPGDAEEAYLDLSSLWAQNCWRCTAAGSPSKELPTKSQLLSTRLIPGKTWWQEGGCPHWVMPAIHSWAFSSCAQPSSLSPATACVLQLSSLNRGEQRESQRPCEHAARTDHSHGPTPHCPTAESEGEEERKSVQKWIICRAAQQLPTSLFMFVKHG